VPVGVRVSVRVRGVPSQATLALARKAPDLPIPTHPFCKPPS
jgi:hypothetical protein